MNAVTLLKNDHRAVARLFSRFEDAGDNAHKAKQEIVGRIIRELSIHASIEELVLYPAARRYVPATDDEVLEALEEHHIVKWQLSELDGLSPEDERYDAKVTVLMENVRHHVEEEESELFPQLTKAMSSEALDELGAQLEAAKAGAPVHPHPRAPDAPPANLIAAPAAGLLDRVGDRVKETVSGAADRLSGLTGGQAEPAETVRTAKKATTRTARKATTTATSPAKKAAKKATKTAARTTHKAATTTKKKAGGAARTTRKAATTTKAKATRKARTGPPSKAAATKTAARKPATRKTTAGSRA